MSEEREKPRKVNPYIPWGTVLGKDRGNGQYFYARNAYTPLDEKYGYINEGQRKSSYRPKQLSRFPSGSYFTEDEGFDPYRRYTKNPTTMPDSEDYPIEEFYCNRSFSESSKISNYLPNTLRFRDMTPGGPGHSEFSFDEPKVNVPKQSHWSSQPIEARSSKLINNPKPSYRMPEPQERSTQLIKIPDIPKPSNHIPEPMPRVQPQNEISIQPGNTASAPFGLELKLWLPGGTNVPTISSKNIPGNIPVIYENNLSDEKSWGNDKAGFEPKNKNQSTTMGSISEWNRSISPQPSKYTSMYSVEEDKHKAEVNNQFRVSHRPPSNNMHPGYQSSSHQSNNETQPKQEVLSTPKIFLRHGDWDKILGDRGKVVPYGRRSSSSYDLAHNTNKNIKDFQ